MRVAVSVVLMVAAMAVAPSAGLAETTVILTSKGAPVAAWGQYATVSDFDEVSGSHSLWLWDGVNRSVIAGDQRQPFDLDLGPDTVGAPLVAFSNCAAGDCDIRVVAPLEGEAAFSRETPAAARRAQQREVLPAVAGDALAWVVRGRSADAVWLTVGAQPARRLDWLSSGDRVRDLDLDGGQLAAVVRSRGGSTRVLAGPPDAPRRYARVSRGAATYVGVSLEGARLAFARTCTRRRCRGVRTGFYRTTLGTRRFERAEAPKRLTAFSMGGDSVYWNDLAADRGCPTGGCAISTARPRFSPVTKRP